MVDDKDETSATFVSYSRDDDPIILNSSNISDNIDYNLHSQPPLSIYWGGCAFGSAFYVGVYNAMREKWGSDFYKKMLHSGGSAGTVFAVALALGKSPEYMNHLYSRVAINTRKYAIPIYYGSYFLEVALHDLIMSDPFAYKKLEGRCCFGTTSFFATHRWHVSWESNDDLIACIQASYNIPIYCKRCVGIKDVVVVDGAYGFAGKDLPHGDLTLYVGIDPHAEVTRHLTYMEMMYPSIDKEYDDMVLSGYQAFMDWNGILNKKVGLRQPNYSALYVLWILKVLEFILYLFIDAYYIIYNMITNFYCWCYYVFQRSYHQHRHHDVAAVTTINRKH